MFLIRLVIPSCVEGVLFFFTLYGSRHSQPLARTRWDVGVMLVCMCVGGGGGGWVGGVYQLEYC